MSSTFVILHLLCSHFDIALERTFLSSREVVNAMQILANVDRAAGPISFGATSGDTL